MRKLISNFVTACLLVLPKIIDWMGVLMDFIGLPDAAKQIEEMAVIIGDDYWPLIFLLVGIFLLIIINWTSIRYFLQAYTSNAESGVQNNYRELAHPWKLSATNNNLGPVIQKLQEEAQYYTLPEASRLAYEELRKHGNSAHIKMADKENSPEEMLNYVATAISSYIDIYGKYPPSDQIEIIDKKYLKRGTFTNSGERLVDYNESRPIYIDCCIRRNELKIAVNELREFTI